MTPSERAVIIANWKRGLSATQNANAVSVAFGRTVTRNSVLGVLYRAGLCNKRDKTVWYGRSKAKNRHFGSYATILDKAVLGSEGPRGFSKINGGPDGRPYAPEPIPETPVSLTDLDDNGCRYIHGEPGSERWGYCGAPQQPGRAYCEHHARRCYVTATPRPQAAVAEEKVPEPAL